VKQYIVSLTDHAMRAFEAGPQAPELESLMEILMTEDAALIREEGRDTHFAFRLVTSDGDALNEARAERIADQLMSSCPGIVDGVTSGSYPALRVE
jgi:hypothetical protein